MGEPAFKMEIPAEEDNDSDYKGNKEAPLDLDELKKARIRELEKKLNDLGSSIKWTNEDAAELTKLRKPEALTQSEQAEYIQLTNEQNSGNWPDTLHPELMTKEEKAKVARFKELQARRDAMNKK